jgi:hypothetical protein
VTQLGPKKASVLRSCASHSIQPPQGRAKPSSGAAPHAALRPPPHSAAARSALASVAPSARERHFRLEIEIKIERGKGKMLREEDCRERLHEESEKGGEKKKKGKKRNRLSIFRKAKWIICLLNYYSKIISTILLLSNKNRK